MHGPSQATNIAAGLQARMQSGWWECCCQREQLRTSLRSCATSNSLFKQSKLSMHSSPMQTTMRRHLSWPVKPSEALIMCSNLLSSRPDCKMALVLLAVPYLSQRADTHTCSKLSIAHLLILPADTFWRPDCLQLQLCLRDLLLSCCCQFWNCCIIASRV